MGIEVDEGDAFEALLGHIREVRGFDFSNYKRASLERRIAKRMHEAGVADAVKYLRLLETSADEFTALFDTVLINVTSFFRDEPAWQQLAATVLASLAERDDTEPIRVWSAGCASGEETYTIAMVLCEVLGEERYRSTVKIYGSDADDDAIATARRARYRPDVVEAAVGPERVARFFTASGDGLVFRSDLRRSVIFGRHDLLQDPPISRVDLILCRNTLMYFNVDAQRRILASFHFALNDGGHLFLGKSEALATRSELYRTVDLKHHIFARSGARNVRPLLPGGAATLMRDGTDELLRAGFETAGVAQLLVDRRGSLVAANRHARRLFGIGSGDIGVPFRNLEVSYRPVELRSRIEQVLADRRSLSVPDVEWTQTNGTTEVFEARLQPAGPDLAPLGVAISFVETGRYKMLRDELEHAQRQLGSAYEELQSTVEELETTNEELQSTNEELETTNEELHSTNEELETMNEELQSTNEELETINREAQERSAQLDQANSFLGSILASLDSAIVVLDTSMNVRIWNEQAEELWGLRADEVADEHFMNLDIGLSVETLRTPIKALTVAGPMDPRTVTVDAVNRRGRSIRCVVTVAQLLRPAGSTDGVIIRMDVEDADADGPRS